jgi:hypothetical protein
VHDAAYSLLARVDRRRLHGLVARRLEREAASAGRLSETAADLARHYAAAADHPNAARLGRLAAEWAEGRYANEEAIAAYGIAVDAIRAGLRPDAAGAGARRDLAELLLAQSRVMRRGGRFAEAEQAIQEGAALRSDAPPLERARWQRELSVCAGDRKAFEEEDRLLLDAEALLGGVDQADPGWWPLWIELRADRAGLAYWLGRTDELADLLGSLEEPVARHGSTDQRSGFDDLYVRYLHRRDAFAPSEEVMTHARRAYAIDRQNPRLEDRGWAEFSFGFASLFDRDTTAAITHLGEAVAVADILQGRLLEARATTYLSIAHRLARQADACTTWTARAKEVSARLGIEQYVAVGLANQAWLRLLDGDAAAARRLADEASARWPASPPLPLRWLDTWPAMAADAELGDPGRAVERSGVLLDPGQWPPVVSVAEGLRALAEADGPETELLLARVLDLAREAGYL